MSLPANPVWPRLPLLAWSVTALIAAGVAAALLLIYGALRAADRMGRRLADYFDQI